MTRAKLDRIVHVCTLIEQICRDHALTKDRIAGLLGEHPSTVAGWETGRDLASEHAASRLEHLAGRLSFASLQRWKERVMLSHGLEMLIGRDLTILAVSTGVLRIPKTPTSGAVTLTRDYFVGKNANDLLPTLDCNLILRHGSGFDDLRSIGFFDGRIRCVRYSAELNYGNASRSGVYEFWPIDTVDAGIVSHHVCHRHHDQKQSLHSPGVLVHWSEIVPGE